MAELFFTKDSKIAVDANQLTTENVKSVALWCGGLEIVEHDALNHSVTYAAINVPTLSGIQRAQEGDWIIRMPTGDFLPVKNARFRELFEPVK